MNPEQNAADIIVARLLPHAPPMVLLDSVAAWDSNSITCLASSHKHPDNPLRIGRQLSIYCGVEYAAQAMAAHAKLQANQEDTPRRGFVATASKLTAYVDRLDEVQETLSIRAQQLAHNGDTSLYQFSIKAAQQTLLEGQLMVIKQAPSQSSA